MVGPDVIVWILLIYTHIAHCLCIVIDFKNNIWIKINKSYFYFCRDKTKPIGFFHFAYFKYTYLIYLSYFSMERVLQFSIYLVICLNYYLKQIYYYMRLKNLIKQL